MPTTLMRYVRRQILLASTFVLVAFLGLFTFFDFLAEMEELLRPGVRIGRVLLTIVLGLPARVYELAPLAALIGSVYALAGLASTSQFTAMRSAGLDTRMALGMMMRTGVVIVFITIAVGEVLTPMAERYSITSVEGGRAGVGRLSSGQWMRDSLFRDGQLHRVRYVNFDAYQEGEGLRRLNVYEFTPDHRMVRWLQADKAVYAGKGVWQLSAARERVFEPEGAGIPQGLTDRASDTLAWESSIDPDLLSGIYIKPERMSAIQLWRYQGFLQSNRQNSDAVQLALAKKIVYPLAVLVMMVIALPFAYLQVRSGGTSVKIFAGIMLGIAFYLMNSLFSHLSVVANLPPLLSATVPSLIALTGGLVGLWWVNRV